MSKSKRGRLNKHDFEKGLITTIFGAALGAAQQLLATKGHFADMRVEPIAMASAIAGISYLMKNLGTNSEDKFLKKETGNKYGNFDPTKLSQN